MRDAPMPPAHAIRHGLMAFAVFACVTALFFLPWVSHSGAALIGPPEDNLQDFWNSWYAAAASRSGDFFHTTLIRYPEGVSLYYHSFAYPQIVLLAALTKLLGTEHATLVALQGWTLLLSFPLAGAGAFALVRHFTGSVPAALAGGYVFAFNPSHIAHVMHHAHVSWIAFIPFCVLAYLLALERRSPAWLAAAIAFYALSALSCWYYLFYIAYFIAFHTIYVCVRDNRLPRGWSLAVPVITLLGTLLILSPLLVPMIGLAQTADTYYGGTNIYVADMAGYFTFPPTHLLAGWTGGFFAKIAPNPWEGTVYLGLIDLGLIAWLAMRGWRRSDPVLVYVLCGMATFCVFASGDTLHAFGQDLSFLHLPDAILSKLPFFANVRTPSRAIVMVYLFLAIGVGHALSLLWERRGALARGAAALATLLLVIDFYPAHLATTGASCPAALDIIRKDTDHEFAVLDLPAGYIEGNVAMFRQTCHGRPILQGIVSRQLNRSLADRLPADPAARRGAFLRAHVKYIILSDETDGLFVWRKADGSRSQYEKAFAAVYRGAGLTILQVY